MSEITAKGGSDDPGIDHRDDNILRALVPDAYGSYGFDSHRANLLVRGMVIHDSLKEALAKRVQEEITDRAAAQFAKSLDILNPELSRGPPSREPPTGQSDGGTWTKEMTVALVTLHAQRVPFKAIAAQIEGKEVKGCQEHFYAVVKVENWKQLHRRLRDQHDAQ